MKRILQWLPTMGIVIFMTVGEKTQFSVFSMRYAAVLCVLCLCVHFFWARRRQGTSAIDRTFLLFIAIAGVCFWVAPEVLGKFVAQFCLPLLYLFLFGAAIGPLVAGKEPFTTFFAKKQTQKDVWDTDIFKNINKHITIIWAAIFALSMILTLFPSLGWMEQSRGLQVFVRQALPPLLLLGVGVPANRLYPSYYLWKMGLASPEKQ